VSSPSGWVGHGVGRAPWLTILSGLACIAMYMHYGPSPAALMWTHDLYMHEPLRLITAHFVHCDPHHFWWNLPPFLLQGWMLERYGKRAWLIGVAAGIAGVDIYLALWPGAPMVYCGLSGLLNAMLVMIVFHIWLETGYYPVILIAGADFVKITAEITNGGAIISSTSWPSVPEAHAFGFAAAVVVCAFSWPARRLARGYPATPEAGAT